MPKFYCYVDETGQDTKGDLFIVTIVILEMNRSEIQLYYEDLENQTGKGNKEWRRSPL